MSLVSMSIMGGILIIVVTIIRLLSHRCLPARFFVLLWMIISLRMLIPWSFTVELRLPVSLYQLSSFPSAEGALETVQNNQSGRTKQESAPGEDRPANVPYQEPGFFNRVKQGQNTLERYHIILWIVWLAGIVACIGSICLRGHEEHQILKEAIPLTEEELKQLKEYIRQINQDGIPLSCFLLNEDSKKRSYYYVSDRIRTPVTVGVFHPRIVLSRTMTSEEPGQLMYVLLHESVHVRRKDTLMKAICLTAVCVHWFNPLGWIMFHFLKQDIEYACDEAVIQITGSGHRKKYANSIVLMASAHVPSSTFSAGFSAEVLRRRIIHIMKHEDHKARSIGCTLFLVVFMTLSFVRGEAYAVQKTLSENPVISETEPVSSEVPDTITDQWIKRTYFNSDGTAVTEEENQVDEKGSIIKSSVHHVEGVPEGTITEYALDSLGRRRKGEVYRENGLSAGITLEYLYQDNSDRVSGIRIHESSEVRMEEYQYDDAGNEISCTVKDSSENVIMSTQTVNTYNANGQIEKSESVTYFGDSEQNKEETPQLKTSVFQYDELGRITREDLYSDGTGIGYYEYIY